MIVYYRRTPRKGVCMFSEEILRTMYGFKIINKTIHPFLIKVLSRGYVTDHIIYKHPKGNTTLLVMLVL